MWCHLHKRGRNMWVFLRNTETAIGRRTGNWSPGLSLRRGSEGQPGRSWGRWSITCPFLCLKKCLNHLQVLTSLIFNRVAKVVHHRWSVKNLSPINRILCSWQNLKSCRRVYRASQAPISLIEKAKMLTIPWGSVELVPSWLLWAHFRDEAAATADHTSLSDLARDAPFLWSISPGDGHPAHLTSGTPPLAPCQPLLPSPRLTLLTHRPPQYSTHIWHRMYFIYFADCPSDQRLANNSPQDRFNLWLIFLWPLRYKEL